ncbi:MAG: acylneuraminate cytidylyltransferase family protein [Pseudomonadota bacterium]
MWRDKSVFAVVPARGGSKGVARKNLVQLAGKSLIAHAASFVANLPWLDVAIISTDEPEMRDEAARFGLRSPFLRPADLAGDAAEAIDVWRHAWLATEADQNRQFDLGIYLEPTSPLRSANDVERCLDAVTEGGYETAATVTQTPPSHSYQKSLAIDGEGRLEFCAPASERLNRRQLVPPTWHRNGLCYAAQRLAIIEGDDIIADRCAGVVVERRTVNIDEAFDFRIAEVILQDEAKTAGVS